MELSKKYLKKSGLKTIDQAENYNHHSIVALNYAENLLDDNDNIVKNHAIALLNVAHDLCKNDYEKQVLSEYSRQNLIRYRDEIMSKIGYRLKNLDECPF